MLWGQWLQSRVRSPSLVHAGRLGLWFCFPHCPHMGLCPCWAAGGCGGPMRTPGAAQEHSLSCMTPKPVTQRQDLLWSLRLSVCPGRWSLDAGLPGCPSPSSPDAICRREPQPRTQEPTGRRCLRGSVGYFLAPRLALRASPPTGLSLSCWKRSSCLPRDGLFLPCQEGAALLIRPGMGCAI